MGAVGAVMATAAWIGGNGPVTITVLLLVAAAFALVVRHPHIGISVFLTTFLINYPGVAKGIGYLTINNVLGLLFLSLLAWTYYINRDAWYLRPPLVRMGVDTARGPHSSSSPVIRRPASAQASTSGSA